jgi:DNA-binding NarL/FixJ family response regulator
MGRENRSAPSRTAPSRGFITVGVVARPAAEREALVACVDKSSGFRALDCGGGSAASVEQACDLGPHLLLVGLDPGPATSFAASVRAAATGSRVVVLLRSEAESDVARLAAAGVSGFVPPGAGFRELLRALRAVRRRGFACPPKLASVAQRIAGEYASPTPSALRGRMLQVAECVAAGMTNKEIADRLRITEGTVKNHVHGILTLLGVRRRWDIAPFLPDSRSSR